jgi:hypothetical protein
VTAHQHAQRTYLVNVGGHIGTLLHIDWSSVMPYLKTNFVGEMGGEQLSFHIMERSFSTPN